MLGLHGVVVGLKGMKKHNGRRGRVVAVDPPGNPGRYQLHLPAADALLKERDFRVKYANFEAELPEPEPEEYDPDADADPGWGLPEGVGTREYEQMARRYLHAEVNFMHFNAFPGFAP
jgi:hypothetical protein